VFRFFPDTLYIRYKKKKKKFMHKSHKKNRKNLAFKVNRIICKPEGRLVMKNKIKVKMLYLQNFLFKNKKNIFRLYCSKPKRKSSKKEIHADVFILSFNSLLFIAFCYYQITF